MISKYEAAISVGGTFLTSFLNKCRSRNEDVDFRPLFENFVHDLLTTVNKPEWPATELLLSLLGTMLVSVMWLFAISSRLASHAVYSIVYCLPILLLIAEELKIVCSSLSCNTCLTYLKKAVSYQFWFLTSFLITVSAANSPKISGVAQVAVIYFLPFFRYS